VIKLANTKQHTEEVGMGIKMIDEEDNLKNLSQCPDNLLDNCVLQSGDLHVVMKVNVLERVSSVGACYLLHHVATLVRRRSLS